MPAASQIEYVFEVEYSLASNGSTEKGSCFWYGLDVAQAMREVQHHFPSVRVSVARSIARRIGGFPNSWEITEKSR